MSSNRRMGKKMWHIYRMGLDAAIKKSDIMAVAEEKWIELEIIALGKATWTQKNKCDLFSQI